MSDVFISYKREDLAAVHRLVQALRAEGVSVWWDQDIPPNAPWEATIERELAAAKLVIVAWSPASVGSDNVKAEARWARSQGRLLQVFVEPCEPPLFFGERQGVELQGWSGAATEAAFRNLLQAVRSSAAPSPEETATSTTLPAPLTLPSKPSVAVLPFSDMTGTADYFTDGMVEEIATALSRFPSLFVNAGGANVVEKEGARNLKAIAQELGVRYLLEGSVRKAGERVRIAVKLVDPAHGEQLWAERFDGTLEDVFELQDQVANAVASQIEPSIEAAEIRRAHARPTQDLGAYDLWLRALHMVRHADKRSCLGAIALLDQAIARDQDYGLALALASYCRSIVLVMTWSDDPGAVRREGLDLSDRALQTGSDDPQLLAWVASAVSQLGGDPAAVDALIERALMRNPGASFVWYVSGWLHVYGGRHLTALEHFETVLRLDPRSPDRPNVLNGRAWALLGLRRFEEAITAHREAVQLLPGFEGPLFGLAVSCAHLGRITEARTALERVPMALIRGGLAGVPFRDPAFIELLRSGLALAGVDV